MTRPEQVRLVCDVCSSVAASTLFEATDHRERLGGRFRIVACIECGLARTEPRPDDLAPWYPDDYRNHTAREPLTVRAIGRALRYTARPDRDERVARVLAWAVPNAALGRPVRAGARVLDVGAGNGSAVAALRTTGLDAWGVEPSEEAAAVARASGIDTVITGTLESSGLAQEKWDVIRLTHVLEHVPSPVTTLRASAGALATGGRLVVLVPNFGGAGRRLFGRAWDGLEVPRHLHHFTAQTLARALAAAGLRVASLRSVALFGVIPASIDAWLSGGTRQRAWSRSILVRGASYPLELALGSIGLGDGLLAVAVPHEAATVQ